MSWTCPGHYKVHVHGRDSPGRPVHGHCPIPLPALPSFIWCDFVRLFNLCSVWWCDLDILNFFGYRIT